MTQVQPICFKSFNLVGSGRMERTYTGGNGSLPDSLVGRFLQKGGRDPVKEISGPEVRRFVMSLDPRTVGGHWEPANFSHPGYAAVAVNATNPKVVHHIAVKPNAGCEGTTAPTMISWQLRFHPVKANAGCEGTTAQLLMQETRQGVHAKHLVTARFDRKGEIIPRSIVETNVSA